MLKFRHEAGGRVAVPACHMRIDVSVMDRARLFPLTWNQLLSWMRRIFDGGPEPLRANNALTAPSVRL